MRGSHIKINLPYAYLEIFEIVSCRIRIRKWTTIPKLLCGQVEGKKER